MDIYLIEQGGGTLRLPVNPAEISLQREKLYETVNIMTLGEIDFSYGERVKEITFSSFFPAEYDGSFCQFTSIPDPQEAMEQLETWTKGANPVRLVITGGKINTLVLISAHRSSIKGGEPGDVYYDLTLRTWREIKVRTQAEMTSASAGSQSGSRPDLNPTPNKYTIKTGDSLWSIAQRELGDGSRWTEIYDLNKDVIGNKPELIYAGTELVMPS